MSDSATTARRQRDGKQWQVDEVITVRLPHDDDDAGRAEFVACVEGISVNDRRSRR